MSIALQVEYRLEYISCADCGVPMFIPENKLISLRRDHDEFYCINGHMNYFPQKSDNEKLKEQLAAERRGKELAQRQATSARNSARAQKAAKTRIKNRIKNGVCPCCNRTFQNLHKHMQSQHPDYSMEKKK